MASHRNEEAKLLAQDEGPIASRLRSRFKSGDVKTYHTGKRSRLSRHQKDKSNSNTLAEKSSEVQTVFAGTTKKSNIDSPSCIKCLSLKKSEDPSETMRSMQGLKNQRPMKIKNTSNTLGPLYGIVGKEKEKTRPSQKQANRKSIIKEHPVYYIRWKGFEETSTCWNCTLCNKDMAYLTNEEEQIKQYSSHHELQYSLFPHHAGD